MSFDENTGAAATAVDEPITTNETAEFGGAATDTTDFLDTPAAKMAPKIPEIHQGTVTAIGVTVSKNTGTKGIQVDLQSKDTGAADRFTIWAPQEFFDPALWTGGKFNLDALATVPVPGKKQSPRQRYAATINSESAKVANDGTYQNFADVQLLRTIAKDEGRTLTGVQPPVNGEDFVALLNSLCAGVDVVYTRRVETSEEFGDQLKVNRLLHPSVLSLANFDKKFPPATFDEKTESYRGYRRAWAE